MSHKAFTGQNTSGVVTDGPVTATAYTTLDVASHIDNKLPPGYPSRGVNKPLSVTLAGDTKPYSEKAFGVGRTQNPYLNNYKGKFDNRYPSIWRKPVAVEYVRGLDDWERAALSAALGVPWTPTAPGTGGPPEPGTGGPPASDGGPSATLEVYGPFSITFSPSVAQIGGAAAFDTVEPFELYIAIRGGNKKYFAKASDNILHELTISANGNNLISQDATGQPIISNQNLTYINSLQPGSTPITNPQIITRIRQSFSLSSNQVSVYMTGYDLVNPTNDNERYPILYTGSVFIISYTDQSEYQIEANTANNSQAYFIKNINGDNVQQTFNIKDSSNEPASFTQLLGTISNLSAMESIAFDNLNIIPLSQTTGGKFNKNKNKSRRFRKHFRKTRKSNKE